MAVDTAGKRFSMLSFGRGSRAHPLPIPDGSFDASDRSHLLGLYAGITLGSFKSGPFIVVAAQVAVPGAIACQVAVPGAIEGQVATPGAIIGQVTRS